MEFIGPLLVLHFPIPFHSLGSVQPPALLLQQVHHSEHSHLLHNFHSLVLTLHLGSVSLLPFKEFYDGFNAGHDCSWQVICSARSFEGFKFGIEGLAETGKMGCLGLVD